MISIEPQNRVNGLNKVNSHNLSDQVYLTIRDALMDGELKEGQRLKIRELATEMGVSGTPVREAIFRLVSEQALEMKAATSVCVPKRSSADLRQIRMIRLHLEGEMAFYATEKIRPHTIEKLEAIHAKFIRTLQKNQVLASAINRQFHFTLCREASMDIAMHMITNMWTLIGPTLRKFYERVPKRDLIKQHKHEVVLNAMKNRDAEGACRAMKEDIMYADVIIRWVEDQEQKDSE